METSFNGLLGTNYSSWKSDHGKLDNTKSPINDNGNESKQYDFLVGAREIIMGGPLNILLPFGLVGMIAYYGDWNEGVTFAFSLLAIAPLAERLGYCTEQLALHTNDSIGGLLNATFGNATEVIVGITALTRGLYRVVQLSLLGSVLSNLLLVLGCSFFFGGLKFKTQSFGKISSQMSSTLLILGTMCLVFPAILTNTDEENHNGELNFSRAVSLFLLITYGMFIYFQIFTHRHLYEEDDIPDDHKPLTTNVETNGSIEALVPPIDNNSVVNPMNVNGLSESVDIDFSHVNRSIPAPVGEEEEEEDILGFNYACLWLAIITVLIAILSDAISATIEDAGKSYNISGVFLSTIVLPIIGNAAEHASAVIFGMRNKQDLSLGIAIGSSCQIAVFVVPLMVVVGWIADKDMSLNFGVYESITLFMTVICVTFAIKDGTSNFFLGFILIVAYIIISAGFLCKYDEPLDSTK